METPATVPPQVATIGSNIVNPPNKTGPSALVLTLVLAAIVLIVGIVGGIIYLLNPKSELFEEPITQAALLEVIRNADKLVSLSSEGYEKYFALSVDAEKFPDYTATGGVLAHLEEGRVTVLFSPVPNTTLNGEQAFIYFDSVKNGAGTELSDSAFNTEFFASVGIEGLSSPVAHMKVDRYAPLVSESKVEDIASVSGRLVLKVPVNVATTTLGVSNRGTEVVTPHATVVLEEFDSSPNEDGEYIISITYRGFGEKFMSAVPLDAAGQEIEHGWFKGIQEGYGEWGMTLSMNTQPNSLLITEAGSMLVKEFPFTLEIESKTVAETDPITEAITEVVGDGTSVAKVTEAEKLLIVAAEEQRYKIFSSRDLSKIRPFLQKITVDPEVKAALNEATDQEILGMIEFMLMSELYAAPGAAKTALLDPNTEWTRVSDTVLKVKMDFGGGSKLTIEYRKIDGVWL